MKISRTELSELFLFFLDFANTNFFDNSPKDSIEAFKSKWPIYQKKVDERRTVIHGKFSTLPDQ